MKPGTYYAYRPWLDLLTVAGVLVASVAAAVGVGRVVWRWLG